ncbi:hypothetical protein BLNAU_4789 [Blattamonas nauphoetae]|uniref:Uncharacterized protein n=1 Tax=Blattamonas nauphoetae TaxID=2049346 RepID=A0ABQ9Y8Z0_9EUKA|nr:hypothetical protein BLNAU_4789 [Blattamonas nauphoetae]
MTQATVEGCSFYNCEAYAGAGIYCDCFDAFELDACNFTECKSGFIAGALRVHIGTATPTIDSKCIIQNSNFTSCSSQYWGGAISLADLVAISLTKLILKNCSSSAGNGGGIDVSQSDGATITDVTFEDCSASTKSGGGLVLYNIYPARKATTLTRVKCVGCSAKDSGAGVFLSIANAASVVSCQFEDCEAGGRGGGLAFETETTFSVTIDDATTFTSCQSTSSSGNALSLRCPNVSTELDKHSFDRFKPPAGQFISLADRRLAFGSEVSGVSQPLSFFWYPHADGEDVHVCAESEDHALSGRIELPFATIGEGFKKLSVDGQKVLIDSPLTFSTKVDMPALAVEMKTSSADDVVTVTNTGLLSLEQGTLTLTNTKFAGSTRDTSFITVTLLGSLSVEGCIFTGFTSTSAGSVLSATLTSNIVSITSSSFSSCSSSENGGALSIVFGSGSSSSSLTVKASFSECSCGVNKLGSAVFVSGKDLESLIEPSQWTTTGLTHENHQRHYWGTDTDLDGKKFHSTSLLVYLVAHSAEHISVMSSEGKDVIGCGDAETPCLTLQKSVGNLNPSIPSNTLTIIDSATLNFELKNSFTHLTLTGTQTSNSQKRMEVISAGKITANSNALSFKSLDFITSELSFYRSLITMSGTAKVTIESCSFTGFHSSISGSVLSGSLSDTSSLAITSSSFSSCTSEEDGGVISVSCSTNLPSSSLVIDTSFAPTCTCGAGKRGEWVFVSGHNFPALIESSFWTASYSGLSSPTDDNLLFGLDIAEDETSLFSQITLLFYLLPYRSDVIYSSSTGRDSNGCGHESTPCQRMDLGHSHLKGTGNLTLWIVTSARLERSVEFHPNNVLIGSLHGQGKVFVPGDSCFVDGDFEADHKLSVTDLTFDLKSATCAVLFSSGVGELILKSCKFERTNSLNFTLVKIIPSFSSSTVVVSNCLIDGKGTSLNSKHVIDISQSTLTMTDSTIQNISTADKGSSSAIFLNEATAAFTRCTFTSLSNPQNGGAIDAELSSSNFLRIKSCTFESCSSKGNGGSVSVVVAGGELEISSSNFTSSSSEQNGGALFVDLSSLGAGSYKLTSLRFTPPVTCAGLGDWVYLVGRSFSSLVTKERWQNSYESLDPSADQNKLWGLDLAESESSPLRSVSLLSFLLGGASRIPQSTVFVGQSGKDQFGCGDTEATMCRTVEWGLTEATGSVVDIVVASNGILSSPIILLNTDVKIASDSGKLYPFVVSLETPLSAPTTVIRVERDSALALSFLSFSFSLPSSINSIIVSSSGVVNMDSCVVQKATLSQPFVVSAQSSHTISNTSFLSSTFKSSAFVLSNCPSLSIEETRIADNIFDTSFLTGSFSQISFVTLTVSNNSVKQDTSLFPLSILPETTSEEKPSLSISLSSFASSQSTPTPLFVSVASECALNVILVNTTFSHWTSSQLRKPAVLVTWTQRHPLLLRRRVVCEDCFVMVSQSQ